MVSVIDADNQYYWRGDWAEKYRDDGIVAAARPGDFHCNVCDATYTLEIRGSRRSDSTYPQGHRKKTAIPPSIIMDNCEPAPPRIRLPGEGEERLTRESPRCSESAGRQLLIRWHASTRRETTRIGEEADHHRRGTCGGGQASPRGPPPISIPSS